MRIEYRVIVTWGTNPGATFSTSESRKDAEKLRALAIRKKYYDARIERVEVEEDPKADQRPAEEKDGRGKGRPRPPHWRRGKVRDMRPRSEKAMA